MNEPTTNILYKKLGANIVVQAVKDWNALVEGRTFYTPTQYKTPNPAPKVTFDELRKFFKSDWGKQLCTLLNCSSEKLLAQLEEWREQHIVVDIDAIEQELLGKIAEEDAEIEEPDYDPCDRCVRNICYGCEHCGE